MGKIVKKVKSERGSITVFILSTMLVIIAVIFTIYFNKMNKISNQEKELNKIQEEYMQGSTNDIMAHLYEESTANRNATLVRKWVNKIDGNGEEEFLDVEKTSDGGYIAVGYTTSTDIAGLTNKGSADCLIAKYDANGNEEWKKSVGGSKYDEYSGVIEITDGTYIAVGTISSTDVLDKNGNNIGHGYDWEINFNGYYSMDASEGIIGTYDKIGNEISLGVTGLAVNNFYEGDVGTAPSNVVISGIDKASDGGYILTGSRTYGIPSTFLIGRATDVCQLAIKYNYNGEIMTTFSESVDEYGENNIGYSGALKGVLETSDNRYVLFGEIDRNMHELNIFITDENLKSLQVFGEHTDRQVKNLILDSQNNFIALEARSGGRNGAFIRLYKQNGWEKTDIALKSISKRNEESFVGISEDDKFLVYDMNDGNVLNEYEIPTYENIYAIEGEDEFILLRYSNK